MNLYLITLFEIIYINYTFWFMKTKYYITHPLSTLQCFEITEIKNNIKNFFKHPIYKGSPDNYICPFGKFMIIILSFYLVIRLILFRNKKYYNSLRKFNMFVLLITFTLSLMNMNAVIYLIPFFMIEILQLFFIYYVK